MSERATGTPGLYVRHSATCADPDGRRCDCTPSYRGRRRNPETGKPEWSHRSKKRSEIIEWIDGGHVRPAAPPRRRLTPNPTFKDLGNAWLDGVKAGAIRKRRGKGRYSETTLQGYEDALLHVLIPEFGDKAAAALDERHWQRFIDRLAREGKSRSRINNVIAVARAIYGWAALPSRQLVPRNTVKGVELPPGDENRRDLVLGLDEIEATLAALTTVDALPYAIAFGAGLRRAEIDRLDWADVHLKDGVVHVRKAKSEAGTDRWPPMQPFLRKRLRDEWVRRGQPKRGKVVTIDVMGSRLAERATKRWTKAKLTRVTLHTGRHTYASHLMAAGYTLTEHQAFMGHADLQMTARYSKVLPPRDGDRAAERLEQYASRPSARAST